MALARALTQTTFDEYLPLETDALAKHELVSGYIHAMGGASDRHEIIVMNLAAHLHMHLRKGPCVVMAGDMKVKADEHNGYYPDIGVYCDPGDNQALYRNHPTVIVEVLSASTAGLDKTTKRFYYQRIDTLREYVLIEQDKFAIAVDRRIGNAWETEQLDSGETLDLRSIGFSIPVLDIYEKVPGLQGGSAPVGGHPAARPA